MFFFCSHFFGGGTQTDIHMHISIYRFGSAQIKGLLKIIALFSIPPLPSIPPVKPPNKKRSRGHIKVGTIPFPKSQHGPIWVYAKNKDQVVQYSRKILKWASGGRVYGEGSFPLWSKQIPTAKLRCPSSRFFAAQVPNSDFWHLTLSLIGQTLP